VEAERDGTHGNESLHVEDEVDREDGNLHEVGVPCEANDIPLKKDERPRFFPHDEVPHDLWDLSWLDP
jgi:hypothetical protein